MARRTKEQIAADEAAAAAKAAKDAPEGEILDGVFIVKVKDEAGNIGVNVIPNGKLEVTEVETVLGLGLKKWRADLGLSDR